MSTINTTQLAAETARIAAVYNALATVVGSGETNTISKAGENSLAAILATADSDILNALLPEADIFKCALAEIDTRALARWLWALDQHVGGLNDFLDDNAMHIHYHCKTCYPTLLPRSVFPPVTELGTLAMSDADTGTITVGDSVDTDLYGDGLIELYTTVLIGAADLTGTVYGTDIDGNSVQADFTVSSGTATETVVAISGTTRFVSIDKDLTEASLSGGTNGDALTIRTTFDREPTGMA